MPVRGQSVACDQASILPFLRPKPSFVADGTVINVVDSSDDDNCSEDASPAPALNRRWVIIDDDDEVLPTASPTQTTPMPVTLVTATSIPDRQPPDSRSLRAPVMSRPVCIAAVVPHDDSDRDAGHLYEDEVHGHHLLH